jgi:RimJ/RimL family protein N-acetyltransferase
MLRSIWGAGAEVPRAQSLAVIERSLELFAERGAGLWCAFSRQEDVLVGFCGIWFLEPPAEPQLVFGVGSAHARRGYALEMICAVLNYAFDHLGIERVLVEVSNRRTRRLLHSLGLSFAGNLVIHGVEAPYYRAERGALASGRVAYRLSRMPQPLLRL